MNQTIKITLYPSDQAFAENVHALYNAWKQIEHTSLVLEGKAQSCELPPRLRPDGFVEFNGWRHPASEITKIVYYMVKL